VQTAIQTAIIDAAIKAALLDAGLLRLSYFRASSPAATVDEAFLGFGESFLARGSDLKVTLPTFR